MHKSIRASWSTSQHRLLGHRDRPCPWGRCL